MKISKFNMFFLFLLVFGIFILNGCGETKSQQIDSKLPNEDILDEPFKGQTEAGGDTPGFYIKNGTMDNLFIVDFDGDISFPTLNNCNTIDSDTNGLLSCGSDEISGMDYTNVAMINETLLNNTYARLNDLNEFSKNISVISNNKICLDNITSCLVFICFNTTDMIISNNEPGVEC